MRRGDTFKVQHVYNGEPVKNASANKLSVIRLTTPLCKLASTSTTNFNGKAYWHWNIGETRVPDFLDVARDFLGFKEPGNYVVLVRCCGTSSGNNHHVSLEVNGKEVARAVQSEGKGYYISFEINEVFCFKKGDQMQVLLVIDGSPYNVREVNKLTILKLDDDRGLLL